MIELSIFKGMSDDEINELLIKLKARRISFKKDHIILSNLFENDLLGVVICGTASVLKYDYFGYRDILDKLESNSIFGRPFLYMDKDASVIATSDCDILFIDYDSLTKYDKINANINLIISKKINELYERVEILSKRSIRDKLMCYFQMISKKKGKKNFVLPITYIELADYLSVDRSSLMREIKKLKDAKVIGTNGKKISIN